MTAPTTPEQARELATLIEAGEASAESANAMRSLAQQVEALTIRDQLADHRVATAVKLAHEDADEMTLRVEALTAECDALRVDAERYQWLRSLTRGHQGACFDQMWFLLPDVKRIQGQNIMQGSVAQHLDKAIDAARGAA